MEIDNEEGLNQESQNLMILLVGFIIFHITQLWWVAALNFIILFLKVWFFDKDVSKFSKSYQEIEKKEAGG